MHSDISPKDISIRNAKLVYQDKILFQNLNFYIHPEKTTCILGPSGVGKTTLLRMIAGLENHTAFITSSNGEKLDGQIAYMPQEDTLLPWLNVLDNTLVGYRLRGNLNPKLISEAKVLLKKAGLKDYIKAAPTQLSGGMRQRVALIRTVMEKKPYILLDEPFANLDVITKLKLQDLLCQLLKKKTICMVTHDPLEALRLGDYIFVMSGQPASFNQGLNLQGTPPRSVNDSNLLQLEARLLGQLAQAQLS